MFSYVILLFFTVTIFYFRLSVLMVPLFQLLLFHYLQSDPLFLRKLNESVALVPLNSTMSP